MKQEVKVTLVQDRISYGIFSHNNNSILLHILFFNERFLTLKEVVTQLVERSLQTPQIHSSNLFIGKFYLLSIVGIENTKIKKTEA